MASVDIIKILQLIGSVLGLVFSILTRYQQTLFIVVFALALTYCTIVFVCILANRPSLSANMLAIIELVLGIVILVSTIYILSTCSTDVMMIMAIVVGFILPALFFITAYESL